MSAAHEPAHEHAAPASEAGHQHGQVDAAMSSAEGIRALKISLAGLLATALFQGVIALAGGSAALLADTIHNLADAFAAVPLWIAFALARRAANRRYTYGYGRAEDVAGLVVLLFVVFSAVTAAYESYRKLVEPAEISLFEWSLVAAVVGMVGNEIVARYKIRVGQKIGSAALTAEGHHSRADSLTSLAAGVGILGARLGFPLADPLAGFVITVAILRIVWEIGRDILGRLLDAIEPETIDEIERRATAVPGVKSAHDVRARWLGHTITVELHVGLDGKLSLAEAHAIGEQVRHELLDHVPRINAVVVHLDPEGD
jgi:cation diffusion facilitator family transporter